DLAAMAITYGHVYVAQIAMGANIMQTIKALQEAESYDGPSVVIAYSPCIEHGIGGGLANHQQQQRDAVACGYFNLFRYDPRMEQSEQGPMLIDSKEPDYDLFKKFLLSENRFSQLFNINQEHAEELVDACRDDAIKRRKRLLKLG
ncbi:MAG: pyruvate:ferredoxin (flavodoxin) oxidoreductase, partial [Rikenellaceae bacterium]